MDTVGAADRSIVIHAESLCATSVREAGEDEALAKRADRCDRPAP